MNSSIIQQPAALTTRARVAHPRSRFVQYIVTMAKGVKRPTQFNYLAIYSHKPAQISHARWNTGSWIRRGGWNECGEIGG